jgi:hypothetical protein
LYNLQLKPCTDPTAPPGQPWTRGRPPAAVHFWDFPPRGAVGARRVHFALPHVREPRREPFSHGQPPGFLHALQLIQLQSPLSPHATAELQTDHTSKPPTLQTGESPVEARTTSSRTPTLLRICTRHPLRICGSPPTRYILSVTCLLAQSTYI